MHIKLDRDMLTVACALMKKKKRSNKKNLINKR